MKNIYPIKFTPILKEKIWGGRKLNQLLHKKAEGNTIGESWEISDVDGSISIVSNGHFKGKTLKELIQSYPKEILGERNYKRFGKKFPLLIKFIDAAKPLSVQLHPDDKLAIERHQSFGKTEMWYVMQADDAANLIVGFNQPMNAERYLKHLHDNSLTDILNFDSLQPGDTYFIEAGRIHAIGAGVLLAEIQQTSDITYRVYDWDRVDEHGHARELHNDVAIDAFKFELKEDFRVDYDRSHNFENPMVCCDYFSTNFLKVSKELIVDNDKDSFIIYMCVEGHASISINEHAEDLAIGETLLLPAAAKSHTIIAQSAQLLQIYV